MTDRKDSRPEPLDDAKLEGAKGAYSKIGFAYSSTTDGRRVCHTPPLAAATDDDGGDRT